LIGDRNDNLKALENRKWDAVIDNSGHQVEWTKKSAALLKDNCDLYLYTSSTGVYYPYLTPNGKEESVLVHTVPAGVEGELKMEYDYGVMKANSEIEVIKAFGKDRSIVVRPTYMFGPADRTNRFTHWPIRLSKGGEILIPGKENDPVQYIDVRDVAEWMIRLIETKNTGIFNAVGPKEDTNMYAFVEEAKKAFDVKSTFIKIDDYDFLKENEVHYIIPWIKPIENNKYSADASNSKAKQNGLTFRPLVGVSVASEVSDQPMSNQETLKGAINRAHNAQSANIEAHFWVGIEGGIDTLDQEMEAFAWIVVQSKHQIGKARTGAFFLPKKVQALIRQGKELGEADDLVFGDHNSKQKGGAVGLLTGNVIDRKGLYVPAVIMALIPFKNVEFY